jgi:hypothetical protein
MPLSYLIPWLLQVPATVGLRQMATRSTRTMILTMDVICSLRDWQAPAHYGHSDVTGQRLDLLGSSVGVVGSDQPSIHNSTTGWNTTGELERRTSLQAILETYRDSLTLRS